jgi:hypothetical protein
MSKTNCDDNPKNKCHNAFHIVPHFLSFEKRQVAEAKPPVKMFDLRAIGLSPLPLRPSCP